MKSQKILSKYLYDNSRVKDDSIAFFNIKDEPFTIYGLYDAKNQSVYKRLPDEIARNTSEGVNELYKNTSGGRIRFATNSDCIAIRVKVPHISLRPHITMLNSMGFDLYLNQNGEKRFAGCYKPPVDTINEYEGIITFADSSFKEITINFPLYNDIDQVMIGVRKDAKLRNHSGYRISKPILFYGSSITQGACASRPGLCYEAWISRRLDCDYINLGFAGHCKGEETIVGYMSELDISCFICGYDHNAPNVGYLQTTHANVYTKVRNNNPNIPIILISKPDVDIKSEKEIKRRTIVMDTYLYGIKNGDKNLYFIDGYSLFSGNDREDCTVDGCHPNDIGFYRMANVIGKTLEIAFHDR